MAKEWKIKKRRTSSLAVMLVLVVELLFFSPVSSEYCSAGIGEDMEMECETSTKRYLQGGKVISPGALRPDLPFCGSVGGPYGSSCLPPPANPHGRGCSRIYRCRHY